MSATVYIPAPKSKPKMLHVQSHADVVSPLIWFFAPKSMELPPSIAEPITAPAEHIGNVSPKDLSIIIHYVEASEIKMKVLSPAV